MGAIVVVDHQYLLLWVHACHMQAVYVSLRLAHTQVMGRALRWIAHAHGAFLLYLGGLHTMTAGPDGGGGGKDGALERSLLDNFTRLANHLIFTGLEKKP
jgi:hypothetical protein